MVREDLNPVEEARACASLVDDLGISKEELGRRVGRSRAAISNLIRLLDLPDDVLTLLERGDLSEGTAARSCQARDQDERRGSPRSAAAEAGRCVRTERRAACGGRRPPGGRRRGPHPQRSAPPWREAEDLLGSALGTTSRCAPPGRGSRSSSRFEDRSASRMAAAPAAALAKRRLIRALESPIAGD